MNTLHPNIDAICGKELNERDPKHASEVEGKLYFFCSDDCKKQFDRSISVTNQRLAESDLSPRER